MDESPIAIGFVTGASDSDLRYLRQMGVTDVVSSLRGVEPGAVWEFEPMLALKNKVENAGLRLSVFEGIPVTDRVKLGQQGRDQDIENYCESLRNMGRVGIPVLCGFVA